MVPPQRVSESQAAADFDIPLARPALGEPELAACERTLRSGRLVLGRENLRFEDRLARRCARRSAVAVSSGTAALELALWALGVGRGDEVVFPAFGFPAPVNAALVLGAVPVAADADPATWNLDAARVAEAMTPRTRAVIAVDQFGLATGADLAVAGVPVVEDAACALGAITAAGVPGGGGGRVATLSFHPRKLVTAGEGGAIVCDDDELARAVRALRNQGQSGRGTFARPGTNARLSELAAAVGAAQLERLDALVSERQILASGYRDRLDDLVAGERLSWQRVPDGAVHAYQTFAVLLAEPRRDEVMARMAEAGIETAPATYAAPLCPPFADTARHPIPVARALAGRALALPLYPGMRSTELDRVCDTLREVLG